MRPIGAIDGGAETVARALWDTVCLARTLPKVRLMLFGGLQSAWPSSEKAGLVRASHIGKAVTCLFRMRDLIHYFGDNYPVANNLFAEDVTGSQFCQMADSNPLMAVQPRPSGPV